ncbi:MAG: hypothetical protein QOF42_1956 [Gammaproteobacteria bacterium]|nr:hypothetical protein [Gammaproteobacteria bacterium]
MSPCHALHRLASCAASGLHPPPRPPLRVLLLHRFASRSSVLLSASLFGPSAPSPNMASADFCNRIRGPSDPRSLTRHVCRSPRVLRTHLHAYARRIYDNAFHTCIGLCIFWPAHPTVSPLSASCSSRQRFASGFLPTLSHPRRRCLPLTLAHVGCVEDFHLQRGAPCRAHQTKTPRRNRLGVGGTATPRWP